MSRADLAASFARLTRRLAEAERPLLAAHDLSMWGYVVLTQLAEGPASSQLELAQAIGYDKTRLIARLDELEGRGLVERRADPSDRRSRNIHLTDAGRALHAAAQADIHAMEDELLAALPDAERRALLSALRRLS